MKLLPLGKRLVIELVEVEEKTASGIVLPSQAKEQPQIARVVEVSKKIEDSEKLSACVRVGDKIIYSKYAGTEVKLDGKDYIVIKLDDVLAIVEE